MNADGIVNGFDLAILLGEWGACPTGTCGGESLVGGGEESEEEDSYPTLLWWFLTGDFASLFEWADSQ